MFSYFSEHKTQKQDKSPYKWNQNWHGNKSVITISSTGTRTIYSDRLFSKMSFHTIFMIGLSSGNLLQEILP